MRNLYAISDTHLSFNDKYILTKPMDIFGNNWGDFPKTLQANWEKINKEDIVVIAGDISWAMKMQDGIYDFKFLNSLSGTKVILKGNHDYWYQSKTKMDKFLEDNNLDTIKILANDSFVIGNTAIVGTRLWTFEKDEENLKILNRENIRLEISIKNAIEKLKQNGYEKDYEIICFTHYPPLEKEEVNDTIKILKKYDIKKVYYGHLHGNGIATRIETNFLGIDFKLISADFLNFNPIFVKSINI